MTPAAALLLCGAIGCDVSAAGTTLVAIAGAVFFRERLGLVALVGIAFIVVGAILVNLGTAHIDA
ncbi:hypothetical protein [Williamsia herbipolensis]|uniref:hypothetical protein n=1 Tax=Williamsia herbipolensis TaxID=1603258 RepID=UPI0005F80949|nr:hypothetical protein [Williamsia herbipolensis]